ncbi:hypothetical protein PHET_03252 [Paragonimus heterotremus]|uniref:Uncharacterized protein n=1 Tax=Paragonimus heterotremus TaxID=100268 RepID=A0A8J4X1J7_9TREM|nr:hypothetical protein PHET_03252 [Paragonimus heterotremus]
MNVGLCILSVILQQRSFDTYELSGGSVSGSNRTADPQSACNIGQSSEHDWILTVAGRRNTISDKICGLILEH